MDIFSNTYLYWMLKEMQEGVFGGGGGREEAVEEQGAGEIT